MPVAVKDLKCPYEWLLLSVEPTYSAAQQLVFWISWNVSPDIYVDRPVKSEPTDGNSQIQLWCV